MSTAYDQLDYPSIALPQTHPTRLATLAMLHGMSPPVEAARVLELGCGDGLNLISIAVAMPQTQCVGVDLAERPIARGRELADRVGVTNLTLLQMDLMDLSPELGTFDYIIAHGLYSWVPAIVRDRLLQICGRHLVAQGIAYISYNAYPGAHLRQMIRQMMLFHVRNIEEPKQRVAEARKLLAVVVQSHQADNPITALLHSEFQRINALPDAQVFHDDLAPINDPVAFADFTRHIAQHDLQYVAEADLQPLGPEALPPALREQVARFAGDDLIASEMYNDFLRDMPYRQTLICRGDVPLRRPTPPALVRNLYISSNATITSGDAIDDAVLATLRPRWPGAIAFDELLELSRVNDAERIARSILTLRNRHFLHLHARPPAVVREPAQRPQASPLARVQAEIGDTVTTLEGVTLRLAPGPVRKLLALLDGTRARAELAKDIGMSAANLDARLRELGQARLLIC